VARVDCLAEEPGVGGSKIKIAGQVAVKRKGGVVSDDTGVIFYFFIYLTFIIYFILFIYCFFLLI